jgi:hypothetical protein
MSDEFEQAIRDALRRADSLAIPVPPLDPDEIAARPSRSRRAGRRPGTAGRLLALAAALVLVAGFGLAGWWWLARSAPVAAVPSAGGEFRVEVDLYSGRPNPDLTLDPAVSRELYLMLGDIEAAGELQPVQPPDFGLGFRGFVVTPKEAALPVLRILPTTVHVLRDGTYELLDDPDENFYTRVYRALRPLLADEVFAALPSPTPSPPELTATMPPRRGDTATWVLAEPAAVSPATTTLQLDVTRLGCAGGRTGVVLEPTVSSSATQVIIRTDVEPGGGPADCQGNDGVRVRVELGEPIGNRTLLDAACLEGEAVDTRPCAEGAVRWEP